MPFDISKFSQAAAAYPSLDSVRELLARTGLDEAERIRELMRPTVTAQSLLANMAEEEARQRQSMMDALNVQPTIDRLMEEHRRQQQTAASFASQHVAGFMEDERRVREHYRELLSSPTEAALKTLFQHARDVEHFVDLKGPALPAFEAAASADRLMKDALQAADPFRTILDQLRADQLTAASWLHQMQSAAEAANRFSAWPVGDEAEVGTAWEAIAQSLASVHAAIQKLPPQQATQQQLQATGLSRAEWLMLVVTLFGVLLQLLSHMESLEQGRFAREQAAAHQIADDKALAEQRAFRRELLSAFEQLAKRAPPTQNVAFVVGSQPATIRDAPKVGQPIGTAYPNQPVIVVDHRGRWVKIQFRDNLADSDVEGWVLKHYLLRQIPPVDKH